MKGNSGWVAFVLGVWVGVFGLLSIAVPESRRQANQIELLKFHLAQPDPHAVRVIRSEGGELIALPKEDEDAPR